MQHNTVKGPHPAGNVGVQIHHIDPINKGDVVWTINVQDVLMIGRLFRTGTYDATRVVAVTGSEAKLPKYVRTIKGARITDFIGPVGDGVRVVSGRSLDRRQRRSGWAVSASTIPR